MGMDTLEERMALARIREVHTVVNTTTGKWLSEYSTRGGSDEHGMRNYPYVHCCVDSPLQALVFDDKHKALEISNALYGAEEKAELIVVTLTLPT